MPHEWLSPAQGGPAAQDPKAPDDPADRRGLHASGAPPTRELHLWPHRSLSRRGFVAFFGATAVLMALPLLVLLGTMALWGLLPFLLAALALLWAALARSWRDGTEIEVLKLWPDRVELCRRVRRGRLHHWAADPYWVELTLHERGGPVPQYLVLRGAGRQVEIGAFLPEPERVALAPELRRSLAAVARRTG